MLLKLIAALLLISFNVKFNAESKDVNSLVRICPDNIAEKMCLGIYVKPLWILAGKLCHKRNQTVNLYMGSDNRDCKSGKHRVAVDFVLLGPKYPSMELIKVSESFDSDNILPMIGATKEFQPEHGCQVYCNLDIEGYSCGKQIVPMEMDVELCENLMYKGERFICFLTPGKKDQPSTLQKYGSPIICNGKLTGFLAMHQGKSVWSPRFIQSIDLKSKIENIIESRNPPSSNKRSKKKKVNKKNKDGNKRKQHHKKEKTNKKRSNKNKKKNKKN